MAETPPSVKVTDWAALRRVVFRDTEYRCSWVNNSAELARYFVERGGYVPLNAYQLREWMRAQVAGGADGSICFFSQDVAPDMVLDDYSKNCLVMRYIRAGGRVVWVGDIPFYYRGFRGKQNQVWGTTGQETLLGLKSVWDLKEAASLTEAGAEWGLSFPGSSSRCVPAGDVTAVLSSAGKYAAFFFKNYNPGYPHSGFLRLNEFVPPAELLRAAQYGIEETDEAAPAPQPAPTAAAWPEDGGELAGSGSFVVDRGRALDKLMRYQLPDPETCLLPLLRCALAGGATAVAMDEISGGLELRFDGGNFTRENFKDAYGALFEPRSAANAAARHLATGLLCALRLKPKVITFSAGAPGARFRFKTEGLGTEVVQPSEDPGRDAVLRILWRTPFGGLTDGRLLEQVRARGALSPVPVLLNKQDLPRSRTGETGGLYFEEKGLHGYINVPAWPVSASRLSAAVDSVLLDNPLTPALPHLQVTGYLNSDDFTMNISQTGVVNNTRCAKAVGAAARRVPQLLDAVLRAHGPNLAAAGRAMLYGDLHKYWKKLVDGGPAQEPGLLGSLLKAAGAALLRGSGPDAARRARAERLLDRAARDTAWLREAAGRMLGPKGPVGAGHAHVESALWNAPLLLTVNAETRSLAQVAAQYKSMGFAPYSRLPYPDAVLPFDVYWCPAKSDLEQLKRWETADLTEKIPHYGVNPAAAEEFMGGSGLRLLAIKNRVEIVPASRAETPGMKPVEISLAGLDEENPAGPPPPLAPAPAPPPPAPKPEPEVRPAPPAPPLQRVRRKPAPLPGADQLEAEPAASYPELLYRRANRIQAKGARLVAGFIKERAAKPKWVKEDLPAEVLASALPPAQKADYLLSVFYTDFNRREVKLTDADDVAFQAALAELALEPRDE